MKHITDHRRWDYTQPEMTRGGNYNTWQGRLTFQNYIASLTLIKWILERTLIAPTSLYLFIPMQLWLVLITYLSSDIYVAKQQLS